MGDVQLVCAGKQIVDSAGGEIAFAAGERRRLELKSNAGRRKVPIAADRYGHLFPGSEDEAAGLLDSYLAAQLDGVADAARTAGAEKPWVRSG